MDSKRLKEIYKILSDLDTEIDCDEDTYLIYRIASGFHKDCVDVRFEIDKDN